MRAVYCWHACTCEVRCPASSYAGAVVQLSKKKKKKLRDKAKSRALRLDCMASLMTYVLSILINFNVLNDDFSLFSLFFFFCVAGELCRAACARGSDDDGR
jgi:hypothetical protein